MSSTKVEKHGASKMTATEINMRVREAEASPKESLAAFLVRPPSNCCPVCAREHDPKQPHVLESLYYQLKFNEKHGRKPTEKDAMAHCTKEVKEAIRKQKEY